jgi:hypothetical protein
MDDFIGNIKELEYIDAFMDNFIGNIEEHQIDTSFESIDKLKFIDDLLTKSAPISEVQITNK